MKTKSKTKTRFIAINKVRPGQEFTYHRSRYRRATADEALDHPARKFEFIDDALVLAYYSFGGKKSPTSFLPRVDGRDVMVLVAAEQKEKG